jgi:acetylornithine deacetylase/succinyl-diaminopimelate desuccinylase family protein
VPLNKNEITTLLQELIRIPSVNPPGKEDLVGDFILSWGEKNGLEVTLDEVLPGRPNAYITLKGRGSGPTLLFNTHMDVVSAGEGWNFDPFSGQLVGDEIYGRGSADTKGSLAAMLAATKTLADSNLPLTGNLILAAVMDEEDDGRGTKHSLAKSMKANFAVVGEPTSLEVIISAKGSMTFQITTKGRAVHSSAPDKGINAIYAMTEVVRAIESLSSQLTKKEHPLLKHPTISVDTIQGGTSPWTVPESCTIVFDRRTLPGETLTSVQEEIREMIKKLENENPKISIEFSPHQIAEAAEISSNDKIVQIAAEETSTVTNLPARVTGASCTTDARYLINKAGIPSIILGPGNLTQAHTANEHVSLTEVTRAAEIYTRIAMNALK